MPIIQAGIIFDKCVPEVKIDGPLLGGIDLGGTAARSFVTRRSCGCGTKVGAAITIASGIPNKDLK